MNAVEIASLVGGIVGFLAMAGAVIKGLLRIEDDIVSIPDKKKASFDEIRSLSHQRPVLIATQGPDFEYKTFMKKIASSIKDSCEERNCRVFLANIGGLICQSPLTEFLKAESAKHDGVHLMKDGMLLASAKMDQLSHSEPGKWADAIDNLLLVHLPPPEETVKVCPACVKRNEGDKAFCRGCGLKLR